MSRKVTKAIFPVAGLGTRFLPATKSIPKEIMTLVDRPLIQYAIDEARAAGHQIGPGSLGENILTAGIDLLGLPTDTRLHLGEAVLRVTGLRNPCRQINDLSPGLLKICVERADGVATDSDVDLGPTGGTVSRDGQPIRRKAGIMAVVERGGQVVPGDVITVELPDGHVPLEPV